MIHNGQFYLTQNYYNLSDPNFRYKTEIPKFTTEVRKGTKQTFFVNSNKFAKSIGLEENIMIKMIGAELSCQSKIDKVNKCGVFRCECNNKIIFDIIENIIVKYLLCGKCDTPEIILGIKHSRLTQNCKACGMYDFVKKEYENKKNYKILYESIKNKT
jgi:translation initiation factor 2 beta subunit (eIF-2beta)/eIF-5